MGNGTSPRSLGERPDSIHIMAQAKGELLDYLPEGLIWPTFLQLSATKTIAAWNDSLIGGLGCYVVRLVANTEKVQMHASFRPGWSDEGEIDFDAKLCAE